MADPITLGIISGVTTVISTGFQVMQSQQQAAAMEKQAEYNQKVYEMEAEQEREAAEFEAEQHKKDIRRLMSAQRAAFAGSGVDLSAGGTPSVVQQQTAMEGELDRQAILYNGEVSATRAENQARLAEFKGKSGASATRTAGLIGAGTTALTGASTTLMRLSSK